MSLLASVQAVLRYTWFDLRSLPPRTLLGLVAGPLLVFVPAMGFFAVFSLTGGDRQDVLLLYPEPAEHPSLIATVSELDDDLVVTAAVDDPDAEARVASGELEFLVRIPVDLHGAQPLEVLEDRGVGGVSADDLRDTVLQWIGEREVTARAGPTPELQVRRPDGTPVVDGETGTPLDWLSDSEAGTMIRRALGWFVVGLIGSLTGLNVGVKIVESAHAGFNHVLGLGTPRRAIYASEMLTGSVMALIQAGSWWVFYALGFAGIAWTLEAEVVLPPIDRLAVDGVLMAVLGVCALVQASALGCFGALMIRNVDTSLRQAISRVAFFAAFLLAMAFGSRASDTAWLVASGLPVVGPVALWTHFADAGQGVWLVPLQGVYTVVALDLGSRLFLMDESPVDRFRRRWVR